MACRPSVGVLYGLNFLLFFLAVAMCAFPFLGFCSDYCNVQPKELKSITFINILVFFGAALLLFSMIGCCLAHTAKKRYRVVYVFVLTLVLLALSGTVFYLYDKGFIVDRISTFDPQAPANVDKAIADLETDSMKFFYEDFATLYEAGDCNEGPVKSDCPKCQVLSGALTQCQTNWVNTPVTTDYLNKCMSAFGAESDCGPQCTEQFCKCTGLLQEKVKVGAQYVKIGAASLTGVLLVLWISACCVERTARKEEAERQRMLEEQQNQPFLAGQPGQFNPQFQPQGVAVRGQQNMNLC